MFNIQGSELIFLLLVALVILGPEKLPEAVRKFGKAYGEFKKMANGFQGELRSALDEPMRELKGTADAVRKAARFDLSDDTASADPEVVTSPEPERPTPPRSAPRRDQGLNFGSANFKRARPDHADGAQDSDAAGAGDAVDGEAAPSAGEPGDGEAAAG